MNCDHKTFDSGQKKRKTEKGHRYKTVYIIFFEWRHDTSHKLVKITPFCLFYLTWCCVPPNVAAVVLGWICWTLPLLNLIRRGKMSEMLLYLVRQLAQKLKCIYYTETWFFSDVACGFLLSIPCSFFSRYLIFTKEQNIITTLLYLTLLEAQYYYHYKRAWCMHYIIISLLTEMKGSCPLRQETGWHHVRKWHDLHLKVDMKKVICVQSLNLKPCNNLTMYCQTIFQIEKCRMQLRGEMSWFGGTQKYNWFPSKEGFRCLT